MSKKKIVNIRTPEELIEKFALDVINLPSNTRYKELENCVIHFSISLPFSSTDYRFPQGKYPKDLKFKNCTFKKGIRIRNSSNNLTFQNCKVYGEFNLRNCTFDKKARFRKCTFFEKTDFSNTVFNDLADFWRSTFKKETIFFKTDFLATVVFSAATFHENVLFTYSLIEKLAIFRGTEILGGLDLSTAILAGELGIFDFSLNDFKSDPKVLSENNYEQEISENGNIPIKNKRETFRILKKIHESQNNIVASLPFKVIEKKTLFKESWHGLKHGNSIFKNLSNLFILFFNFLSNYFGIAFFQGIFFTIGMGILFFYLCMIYTTKYLFAWHLDSQIIMDNIPAFANFLLPTHKFDYLGSDFTKSFSFSNSFFLFDILGRIFVGYGIYQTIQAFRKFR
ncbi:pentapeptide repeat-containing protein [Ulvibacterium marinum]|uniref:pentapeptide repeat-containing protein n=1 Tax=Ulvibacterium marinum TaxID=2419782 RepID=UPI002493DA38|nr:pentapeptide repeat-containing protein [Ulvibacterium marinum]